MDIFEKAMRAQEPNLFKAIDNLNDSLLKSEQKVKILRAYIQGMIDSDIDYFSRSVEEDMRRILKETE